ncbi:mycoredoxin [Dactylosporangium matsuzakiense]|uniref:NrdH-redoxin n=2 Tax=Dactylosporangium TaxID=35753 RepID=A0A9W6KGW8_9ACTN|nr:NrdH-redoxin [Dactylosporangium matsuzakiense]
MTRPMFLEENPMLTMYSTTWCGYCHRLKTQMDREGIQYQVVDIEQNPEAAKFVETVNGGNQTVPTLRFDDGTAMTNPSIVQVKKHLETVGS